MTAIVSQPATLQSYSIKVKQSLSSRFFEWATNEEESHHIAWVCVSITIMAAVLFPITMFAILLNGMAFLPMLMAMLSLATVIVANLAAQPTRYTIPILFIGILVDAIAIILSFYFK